VPKLAKVYRLKKVTKTLTAAGKVKLTFKLDKKTLKIVRKALKQHKKLTAKMVITATDKAGNKTASKKSIKLKR
jgi:hypothetical protein